MRGKQAVRISSRELANACKTGRPNVQRALDNLTKRGILTTRQGTPTTPAVYQVNPLHTLRMGGYVTKPPPTSERLFSEATPALLHSHCGYETTPPPIEKSALARAAAASDFDSSTLNLIDHVCSAKGKSFDGETLARFRRWMWGYMAKCGRNAAGDRYEPGNPPHPPSDDQVAQLLSVADERTITRMLEQLLHENHEPSSYFWFVAVALQRIHRITVETRRKAQAILVDVKRQAKQQRVDAGELPDQQFSQQLTLDAVAGVKKLR